MPIRRSRSRTPATTPGPRLPTALVSMVLVALVAGCGASAVPSSAPTPAPVGTITGVTPCPATDGSSVRTTRFTTAPPMCIDPATTYLATITTERGDLTVTLDAKAAPKAVNNIVVLARYHFYDGLAFDRSVPGVAVGGGRLPPPERADPGYLLPDELPADRSAYVAGTVVMDNDGPDTNGSAFLVLHAAAGVAPKFTIIGHVTTGFDMTVPTLAAALEAKQTVPIRSVTIAP